MKVSLYEAGGRLEGGFTIAGMTLTGPLLLSGTVTSPLEAIHKQYVDTAMTNLDATKFVSGTIPTARLPALSGDVTSSAGSNNIVLNLTGVIAGDYTKVAVDAKGRATSGLSLTEADLPGFSWDKITLNKPNSLSGYGISDGVSTVNGNITGFLTLKGAPTQANHAATKAYADANVSGSSAKIVVGDILSYLSSSTPAGFLRCNGGEISKTTYNALYAVIGDTFSYGLQPGSGQPAQRQYDINLTQASDLNGWSTGTALPSTHWNSQAIVTKNRVYLIGGYINSAASNRVLTAAINSDGSIGAWSDSTALPLAVYCSQVIVIKNRVHLIGGLINGSTATAATYSAPINADGTLGTWTAGNSLPVTFCQGRAVITKGRVYLMGGSTSSATANITATIYTASINGDGTLGTWSAAGSIPNPRYQPALITTKNRIYVIGGVNSAGNSVGNVDTVLINVDGTLGTWESGTPIGPVTYYTCSYSTRNKAYLIGCSTGDDIYSTTINADGTLGTWVYTGAVGNRSRYSTLFTTSSRLYVVGSVNGSTVQYTTITGGLNDLSLYYSGNVSHTDPNNFRIPDYSSYEKTSMYFFIKT